MELRFILAGVLVIGVSAFLGLQLAQITGFTVADFSAKTVTVVIEDGHGRETFRTELSAGESAFDALKRVSVVEYRNYPTGVLVTAVNGVKADESHYWLYFVNGELGQKSLSLYKPADGDVLSFRYLTAEETAQYM